MKPVRGAGGAAAGPPGRRRVRATPKPFGLERVAYFDGQLLAAADFSDEQSYFRKRLRRRNLLLHGAGIVSGLEVSLAPPAGPGGQFVVVEPGFAFDPLGEEIEVCRQVTLPLPPRGQTLSVRLTFVERPADPVPVPLSPGPTSTGGSVPSRIEESFAIDLTAAAREDALFIARLAFRRGRWQIDRRSKPPRVS